jgi:hypothetical protein
VTTFTAPNVTDLTDTRIFVRTQKAGYADGSDYKDLQVVPPLKVKITANPSTIKSQGSTTITVHVTGSFDQNVEDASLSLSSNYGSLWSTTGVTDQNGNALFDYTAPQTLNQINVTITATATKIGYAEGGGQGIVVVEPRTLTVDVEAYPDTILSESTSTVVILVLSDGVPIPNATVAASVSDGSLSPTTGISGINGNITLFFTAPQTTSTLDAVVTVNASKIGYLGGQGQNMIRINPKVLAVQARADDYSIVSESMVNVTIGVTYETVPIQDANVSITSEDGGNFTFTNGLTDARGDLTFQFIAPPVNTPTNITLVLRASKTGFVDGESLLVITVSPGILVLEVKPDSAFIPSREATVIQVNVRCNQIPVVNALVTMTTVYGNLSYSTASTDVNGSCIFTFYAPSTTSQLFSDLTTNATKNGFISAQNTTTLTITPEKIEEESGGLSLTTILLIVIPIVIAVIVVLLIKLKIITVSKEETV